MLRALRKRWTRFFFEPAEPSNLGLCRILFFGALFLFYLPQGFGAWGEVSDVFWMPITLFRIFHLPLLSGQLLVTLQLIWKVSLALSCVGLFTRFSTMSSVILGVYLLGLPHNFGKIHQIDTVVVLCLGIMALARCGDAYSLDRLFRRAGRVDLPSVERSRPSGEYTWPVHTVWLMFALVFFAAGVAKLRHSGFEWIFSDSMAITLIYHHYYFSNAEPWVPLGLHLAQYGWLTRLFAASTVVIEVGYPLALFSRKARWIFVPSMVLMLVGIRALMGPTFVPQYLICHVFWVPWDRVRLWLIRRFRQ